MSMIDNRNATVTAEQLHSSDFLQMAMVGSDLEASNHGGNYSYMYPPIGP
jgi:hypothetical protein